MSSSSKFSCVMTMISGLMILFLVIIKTSRVCIALKTIWSYCTLINIKLSTFLNMTWAYCIIDNCKLLAIFQIVMLNLNEWIKVVHFQKLANPPVCYQYQHWFSWKQENFSLSIEQKMFWHMDLHSKSRSSYYTFFGNFFL